jgi:hypothetical protein
MEVARVHQLGLKRLLSGLGRASNQPRNKILIVQEFLFKQKGELIRQISPQPLYSLSVEAILASESHVAK